MMKILGWTAALALVAAPAFAGDDKKPDDKKMEEHGDKKDAPGEGVSGNDVDGENAKHAMRVAKLDRLDQIAKDGNKAELTSKVAAMRERENKRHDKALARIAKHAGDHGKAGEEHGMAGDDHGKAGDEHGKSADDHGKGHEKDHGKDHDKDGKDKKKGGAK
jgi:hypothetical protein